MEIGPESSPGKTGGDRGEVDEQAIASALMKPGDCLVVEDPRGVAIALGRAIARPSDKPIRSVLAKWARRPDSEDSGTKKSIEELLGVLRKADDWATVAKGAEAESAERILRRARAADELARRGAGSPEVFAALDQRVRRRSLHRDWRYCGLD